MVLSDLEAYLNKMADLIDKISHKKNWSFITGREYPANPYSRVRINQFDMNRKTVYEREIYFLGINNHTSFYGALQSHPARYVNTGVKYENEL
jgi:hypothetical protein